MPARRAPFSNFFNIENNQPRNLLRRSVSVDRLRTVSSSLENTETSEIMLNKHVAELTSQLKNANNDIQALIMIQLEKDTQIKELEGQVKETRQKLLDAQSRMNTNATVKRAEYLKKNTVKNKF